MMDIGLPWLLGRNPGGVWHPLDTLDVEWDSITGARATWVSMCGRVWGEGPEDDVIAYLHQANPPEGPICAHCLRILRYRVESITDTLTQLADIDTKARP